MAFLPLTPEPGSTQPSSSNAADQGGAESGIAGHAFLELTPPAPGPVQDPARTFKSAPNDIAFSGVKCPASLAPTERQPRSAAFSALAIHPSYKGIRFLLDGDFSQSLPPDTECFCLKDVLEHIEASDIPKLICSAFNDPIYARSCLQLACEVIILTFLLKGKLSGTLTTGPSS